LDVNGSDLTFSFNNRTQVGKSSKTNGTDTEMYLYGYNSGSAARYFFHCKLYSFKIYVEDLLVRDFIPCQRKSDSALGLYDIVNKIFYTNSGTGSFIAGPPANQAGIFEDGIIETNQIYEL
jgi:hypothetical protein